MLLFLDIVSPIPEFTIIEDNKVILRQKIISNEGDKLSDNIIQSYIEINNKLNLSEKLQKIVTTIGPGSYTSLRVGCAFISGLKFAKNVLFSPLSMIEIFDFKSNIYKLENLGIFITSSNNQKFFCTKNILGHIDYIKIDNDSFVLPNNIKTVLFNFDNLELDNYKVEKLKISFVDEILKYYDRLTFLKDSIIKPIYISNNKILN